MKKLAALLLPLVLALTACTGDGGEADGKPTDVLATAKAALDETTGVELTLATDELPDGVTGVVKATGFANHQPAFQGDVDIMAGGIPITIAVVAVDGLVYADLPFPPEELVEVDPEDYGAPDPAQLMDPTEGVSNWLTSATDISQADQSRDGDDVLTNYSGTLAGSEVAKAIPTADEAGTFEVTFAIDDDGRLRTATLTGPFYEGEDDVTYDVTLTDYDTDEEITAP